MILGDICFHHLILKFTNRRNAYLPNNKVSPDPEIIGGRHIFFLGVNIDILFSSNEGKHINIQCNIHKDDKQVTQTSKLKGKTKKYDHITYFRHAIKTTLCKKK